MIDVSPKFKSLRYAKAQGTLHAPPEIIERVKKRSVPKGDVLEVARSAGISAAKRTADWLVFCHPIPLDWVEIHFEIQTESIDVFAEPVWDYDRDQGVSITGGYVVRGGGLPSLQGAYIYGDYLSGRIWALWYDGNVARNIELLQTKLNVSSFGVDSRGTLYICDHRFQGGESRIHRLVESSQ